MAAVNRPTDVKQKETDINQKLQLYGIYSGMLDPPVSYPCFFGHPVRSLGILEFSPRCRKVYSSSSLTV